MGKANQALVIGGRRFSAAGACRSLQELPRAGWVVASLGRGNKPNTVRGPCWGLCARLTRLTQLTRLSGRYLRPRPRSSARSQRRWARAQSRWFSASAWPRATSSDPTAGGSTHAPHNASQTAQPPRAPSHRAA